MSKIKKLYKENIYGIIGTLCFHILLVSSFLLAEVNLKGEVKEEPIILDFTDMEELEEPVVEELAEEKEDENTPANETEQTQASSRSNQAVNDAPMKDPFFDEEYQKEIAEAQKLVADVNKQLAKEVKQLEEFAMPEETTEGMDPDSIKNTIYSGESNIHYFLENRYHLRLPIPVYLAQGGGLVVVDIVVNPRGKVIQAEVRKNANLKDPMLEVYAKQAAERTVFNTDKSAPAQQKGTISYTFVAQ
ncbi:hypothetical protein [uncultured Sunxiuqinia sp.]|uniref:hypothetical protein n=1 Tax=Sunxiuqinia rutila TaxID=1397841 RepID=UPI00261E82A3|nr:hypothetical protein [uncultured Sunxiuqinia sp.]